jgi:hypothetical protein
LTVYTYSNTITGGENQSHKKDKRRNEQLVENQNEGEVMEQKYSQSLKRALSKIQEASTKYANSNKGTRAMQDWQDACDELWNYLCRNFVSQDDYSWIKKRYDYREAEDEKQGVMAKLLERIIDENRVHANAG